TPNRVPGRARRLHRSSVDSEPGRRSSGPSSKSGAAAHPSIARKVNRGLKVWIQSGNANMTELSGPALRVAEAAKTFGLEIALRVMPASTRTAEEAAAAC